jgi:hypothetical protein
MMDLKVDQIESFIENINIHCFKHGLAAEEFINIINNVSALSKNLGMPVQQLHRYILQKKLELEKVESKTKDAKLKQIQVLQHYNVTIVYS